MRVILQCSRPLGAILRLFPIAAHLHKQKHEVFLECPESAASILRLVDYLKWWDAKGLRTEADLRIRAELWPMQIFPRMLQAYRTENPPRRHLDFLGALHPEELKGMKREVVLSHVPEIGPILKKYGLPSVFDLACPAPSIEPNAPVDFGIFESWLCDTLRLQGPCYYLAGEGWRPNRLHVCVSDLSELAALIRHARTFSSVTAGPAVLASARVGSEPLREEWNFVVPTAPRDRFQDDISSKGQVRWEVNAGAPVPSIIPLKKG